MHEHDEQDKGATKNASARLDATARVAASAEVVKRTTPDGRIVYDILSLIRSPETQEHFRQLDELVRKGLMPKPKASTP